MRLRSPAAITLCTLVAATSVLLAAPIDAAPAEDHSQLITFADYTPWASNLEMARRMPSPLMTEQITHRLAASGKELGDQPIDLKKEQFRIYVPRTKPAAGYGLLVFIPPWEQDLAPPGWIDILESRGMIFVSGVKTGNLASPIARREPLALLAAYNVMRRYNVDPDRVFISGYSGGSRVALRLALAYPDVFRGAFLDAGADPIGAPDLPLPPRPLFDRFRTKSKLVYFTGAADELHQDQEDSSLLSLKRWCVTNFATRSQMRLTHELAPPYALSAALTELDKPARTLTDKDALCWSRITAAIDDALARAEAAMARSDFKAAQSMDDDADRRFGGLTAPRIVELYRKLRRNAAAPGAQ